MRYRTIKSHLKPFSISGRRKTTINHAFAAATSPNDSFEGVEPRLREALVCLGQDPDRDLACVYCGMEAETWDHLFATVSATRFSGFGHRIGNLVPCCKPCNSKKGNLHWEVYLRRRFGSAEDFEVRHAALDRFTRQYTVRDTLPQESVDTARFEQIRQEILRLCVEADQLAARIRAAAQEARLTGEEAQGS